MSSKKSSKERDKPLDEGEEADGQTAEFMKNTNGSGASRHKQPFLAPEPPPFSWGLVWAGLVIVALFILRRYLRAMFPVFLLFSVFVPLIWYLWRQYRYRDLWDVYRDYDELMSLLHSKRLYVYAGSVEESMKHIMAARDKAEGLVSVLLRADLPGQKARIEALSAQLAEVRDPERRKAVSQSIKDATTTLEGYQRVEVFLGRYSDGKKQLTERFRSLRLKLEVPVVDPVSPSGPHADEIDEMVQQLRHLDWTYETVDGQGQPQTHVRETERD